jgi:hypothetical protein
MHYFKFFFLLFLLLTVNSLYSQGNKIVITTQFELEDIPCDQDAKIARNIDIQMLYNGSFISVKKFEATNCMNSYTVNKINGKFKAFISSDLYLPSELDFEITQSSKDTVYLKAKLFRGGKPKTLDEVAVKSNLNLVKMEGNKTSYSIQNNDALNNGSALESIKKLPGVMTDINGNISLKGKAVTVYVDGLPVNMSGQDLSNYLNSLSSSSVSKIEIINNPGASYEAGTSADVINVVTKVKNQKGINGTLYSAITVYKKDKYENSLSLNGLYKKINWNASLGYNDVDSQNGMSKFIVDQQNGNFISDVGNNELNQKPLNVRLGMGYSIRNLNLDLKYSYAGVDQKAISTSKFIGDENGTETNQESHGVQDLDSRRNELTTTLVYKIKNSDKTIKINYQYFDFDRNSESLNESVLNNTNYYNDNSNTFDSRVNRLKLDLVLPFKKIKFSSGLKYANSDVVSLGTYENSLNNTTNNILFNYKDYSLAGYTEFFKKIKKWDITIGMRYEYIKMNSQLEPTLDLEKSYSNFFPSFNLGYHLNSFTDINFSYSKKVRLPSYQELDPNSGGIMNNLAGDSGNPLLQPSFYDNAELKFNFFKYMDFSFSYSKAKTDNFLVFTKTDGTYQQTTEQFNNVRTFNASMGIPVPLGVFTKGIKYLNEIKSINDINYLYLFGGMNSVTYDKTGFNNDYRSIKYLGVYTQLLMPYEVKMNLQHSYSSPGNFTIYNIEKSYHKLDVTLTRSFFKNSTKVQFSYNDILGTGNKRYALFANDNLNANVVLRNDSQRVKFSVTYSFGSYKQASEKKEESEDRETRKNSLDVKL